MTRWQRLQGGAAVLALVGAGFVPVVGDRLSLWAMGVIDRQMETVDVEAIASTVERALQEDDPSHAFTTAQLSVANAWSKYEQLGPGVYAGPPSVQIHNRQRAHAQFARLFWRLDGLYEDAAAAGEATGARSCGAAALDAATVERFRNSREALEGADITAQLRATADLVRVQTGVSLKIADYEILTLPAAEQIGYLEAEQLAAGAESSGPPGYLAREQKEADLEMFGAMLLPRTRKLLFNAGHDARMSSDDRAKLRHHEVAHLAQNTANPAFLSQLQKPAGAHEAVRIGMGGPAYFEEPFAFSEVERGRARKAAAEGHAVFCAEQPALYPDATRGAADLRRQREIARADLERLQGQDPGAERDALLGRAWAMLDLVDLYVEGLEGVERLTREAPDLLARCFAEPWIAELIFMRAGTLAAPSEGRVEIERIRAFNPNGHRLTVVSESPIDRRES